MCGLKRSVAEIFSGFHRSGAEELCTVGGRGRRDSKPKTIFGLLLFRQWDAGHF